MIATKQKAIEFIRENGGLIRTNEAFKAGIHRRTLYGLWSDGGLIQLSRGLYQMADLDRPPGANLAEISKKAPAAIICLKSALVLHELSDQEPEAVWLAVERKARKPTFENPPVEACFFSGEMFYRGVQTLNIMSQVVRIYNAPKTVIDCFRWHKKVGLDVAIQAARVYLARTDAGLSELMHYAKICKIENRVRPYLRVLLS